MILITRSTRTVVKPGLTPFCQESNMATIHANRGFYRMRNAFFFFFFFFTTKNPQNTRPSETGSRDVVRSEIAPPARVLCFEISCLLV